MLPTKDPLNIPLESTEEIKDPRLETIHQLPPVGLTQVNLAGGTRYLGHN